MKMLISLAFRNVLRNVRRTVLTVTLIGCGLASLIVYDGLVKGITQNLLKEATGTFMGDAQVHREGFRREQQIELTLKDWAGVEGRLQQEERLAAYAPRVIATGMLSSAREVSGVVMYGVDPAREPEVSKLKRAVRSGEFLSGNSETEILIGARLAEILEVGLGDRVVLTAAQAGSGELSQELFRVSGIVKFGSRQMDGGMVFVPIAKARKLLHVPDGVHEVALRFRNPEDAGNSSLPLWRDLSQGGNEALGWRELMPQLTTILVVSSYGTLLCGIILVAVIILSVINSMLMSVHERVFEFGVLKAVGTRPGMVARMILLESLALALVSVVVGVFLGAAISTWFAGHGFDLSGVDYAGTTLTEPVRTVLAPDQFVVFPIFVVILTVVAGIYPAIHAARLVPTQAMRKTL